MRRDAWQTSTIQEVTCQFVTKSNLGLAHVIDRQTKST